MDEIEVRHYDRKYRQDITSDLCSSKQVGLHVIDTSKHEPLVVCLISQRSIYTFRPKGDHHAASFLKSVLTKRSYDVFTLEGVWDADHLRKCMDIELSGCIDLHAFDANQSLRDYMSNNPGKTMTVTHVFSKIKPRRLEYHQLVEKYIGPKLNLTVTSAELESLRTLPVTNLTALNVIRKKCALIRALGIEMSARFNNLLQQPSLSIFSLAFRASDEVREDYERRGDNRFVTLFKTLSSCPERN